jgi:hypothetical protein
MRRLIFFLILLSGLIYSQTDKKIANGAVNITDYQGKTIYQKGKFNPGFKIQMYYLDENGEQCGCPDTYDIRDSWEFAATIKKGCDTLFDKKIYAKPYFGAYPPAGWKVKKPDPSFTLKKDQDRYLFSKPLVIQIPPVLTAGMRQSNFEMAKKVFAESPERSVIFFKESSRGGDYKYTKEAFDLFEKKGYSQYAAYFAPKKDIPKIDTPKPDIPKEYYAKKSNLCGTVILADGSVVPGVVVTISGDLTGTKTTVSSADGIFRFPSLLAGKYNMKFELVGFKTVTRENIFVGTGKTVQLTIKME